MKGADKRLDSGAIIARVSAAKNCMCTPEELAPEGLGNDYDEAAAWVFPRYEAALKRLKALDFDDLILWPLRALTEDASAREAWRRRIRYMLVDEFQDTNRAQLLLVKALMGETGNVFCVGDDDQSIYGWRGADISNVIDFPKHFPGARILALEQNYRSKRPILDLANQVMEGQVRAYPKRLFTDKPGGAPGEDCRVRLQRGRGEVCPRDHAAALVGRVQAQGDRGALPQQPPRARRGGGPAPRQHPLPPHRRHERVRAPRGEGPHRVPARGGAPARRDQPAPGDQLPHARHRRRDPRAPGAQRPRARRHALGRRRPRRHPERHRARHEGVAAELRGDRPGGAEHAGEGGAAGGGGAEGGRGGEAEGGHPRGGAPRPSRRGAAGATSRPSTAPWRSPAPRASASRAPCSRA
jgi:hypothetical protein